MDNDQEMEKILKTLDKRKYLKIKTDFANKILACENRINELKFEINLTKSTIRYLDEVWEKKND